MSLETGWQTRWSFTTGGYVLAVVPSTHRVELGVVRDILGGHLGVAAEAEIARLFDDCELGAVPPIGAAYGLPVTPEDAAVRVRRAITEGKARTVSGKDVAVVAESICVHSDTAGAAAIACAVREVLAEFV
jgi:hypothetical protein